jgi:hypothetical protein
LGNVKSTDTQNSDNQKGNSDVHAQFTLINDNENNTELRHCIYSDREFMNWLPREEEVSDESVQKKDNSLKKS